MRANDDRSINTGVRGAFRTKLLLLISLALVAFMIGGALGAPSGTGGQQRSQSALNDVPGLGRDAEGLLRDDTIALWEHFNREQSVDRCMTAAGFEYDPVADYPAAAIVAVAASLSVQASGTVDTAMPSGRSANRTRVERMSETELDGYYTALYDETAADVAFAAANHGGVPGRDTFAEGGCAGNADAQGPRVFSIRQLVVPALASARAILEPTFDWSCQDRSFGWVSHPSDLEEIDSSTTDYPAASIEACELELEKQAAVLSLQVDAVVAETLATDLEAHTASYDSVPDMIRSDAAFREYLGSQLTDARFSVTEVGADLDGAAERNSATETQPQEPTPAQTSEPEEESDALPPPALQSKPPAFEAQMDKVLGALDARGYDTTTGELGSPSSESRVLAPIAPNSDLPIVLLLLEWGTSEPFGDATTTGSRELPDFTLREIGDGEVWFFCGEMIVRLRADLSEQEFDALAGELYNESC